MSKRLWKPAISKECQGQGEAIKGKKKERNPKNEGGGGGWNLASS